MAKPRKPTSYELLGERIGQQVARANARQQYQVTRISDAEALVSWNAIEAEAAM